MKIVGVDLELILSQDSSKKELFLQVLLNVDIAPECFLARKVYKLI
jgi:hypothetical protein